MAAQTPTQAPASAASSPATGQAPAGTSRDRNGSGAARPMSTRQPRSGQHQAAMRRGHRHMSTRDINQMLAEMGSYTKYSKAVNDCNFDVKLRCHCGRSRNLSWMFLCTLCATGTKVEKTEEDVASKYSSILTPTESPAPAETESKENAEKEAGEAEEGKQRAFLSCDLCAVKVTETYYCPNCLNAYPAQYVKQGMTRCPRCVGCPICSSPVEKIVYAGGTTGTGGSKDKAGGDGPKDSLAAPGDKKLPGVEPQKIGSGAEKKKSKDVYLYQCSFCFWSSNTVGLEAPTSDVLLQNLNNKIKEPYNFKLKVMEQIETKYTDMNEELRKEEERLHNMRHYHKNYKKSRVFAGSFGWGQGGKKKGGKKRKGSTDMELPRQGSGDETGALLLERVTSNSLEQTNAMERLGKKLKEKYEKDHVMPKAEVDNSHVPKLDMMFVSAFNIQHVSPLAHRLNDPLNQHMDLHKYIPQRFHLMTKESYKCPVKVCGQYVCKPHLRGAQANFEKRTAVLDYLPRVVVEVVSGDLLASATSTVLVKFQNRHMESAKMTVDCGVNEKDRFSTANVECSNATFDMDPINIHIKVAQGGTKTEKKFENGDYVNGKEVGIHFKVTPKYYTQADIKFSISVMFETNLEIKKDKAPPKKSDFKDIKLGLGAKQSNKEVVNCQLPYILDIDLGSAKKLDRSSARKASDAVPAGVQAANAVASPRSERSESKPSGSASANAGVRFAAPTVSTSASSGSGTASASASASASAADSNQASEDATQGHKSRGSNELEKRDAVAATEDAGDA